MMKWWTQRSWMALADRRRGALWACTALASGLSMIAGTAWLMSADAAVAQPMVAPHSTRVSLPAADASPGPQPSAQERRQFDTDCLLKMRERLFRQALKTCGAYRHHPTLAARAHAAVSAIYTDPGHLDIEASVKSAQLALDMGEPRAQFLMAAHLLAGHAVNQGQGAVPLLKQAQSHRFAAASAYLNAIEASQACRQQAQALPMGQPLFCLFRAEVHEALTSQGMRLRDRNDLHWQDDFSPGDLLAQAQTVRLAFDVDPQESIHRLARLTYTFGVTEGSDRAAQLKASLISKYGPASGRAETPGEVVWALGDGVVIRLQPATGAQGTVLAYEHLARWAARGQHLQAQQAQVASDRVKADASLL